MAETAMKLECLCGNGAFTQVFSYDAPPKCEIKFQFSGSGRYERKIYSCKTCGHFLSVHGMDTASLYDGDYVTSNYQDEEGIKQAFDRIISLDASKSDNTGRVRRILEFAAKHFKKSPFQGKRPSVLDVGSGLGVFLYRMKQEGWEGTALDPDSRSVAHARNHVGVQAIQGDFMNIRELGVFDCVTFNKVLEHVQDPVAMLAKSKKHLTKNGFVYVEVPDAEAAAGEGPEREEFAIDHPHIFSVASLSILATRAGFLVQEIERLREPSTKFTLRAFLTPLT